MGTKSDHVIRWGIEGRAGLCPRYSLLGFEMGNAHRLHLPNRPHSLRNHRPHLPWINAAALFPKAGAVTGGGKGTRAGRMIAPSSSFSSCPFPGLMWLLLWHIKLQFTRRKVHRTRGVVPSFYYYFRSLIVF